MSARTSAVISGNLSPGGSRPALSIPRRPNRSSRAGSRLPSRDPTRPLSPRSPASRRGSATKSHTTLPLTRVRSPFRGVPGVPLSAGWASADGRSTLSRPVNLTGWATAPASRAHPGFEAVQRRQGSAARGSLALDFNLPAQRIIVRGGGKRHPHVLKQYPPSARRRKASYGERRAGAQRKAAVARARHEASAQGAPGEKNAPEKRLPPFEGNVLQGDAKKVARGIGHGEFAGFGVEGKSLQPLHGQDRPGSPPAPPSMRSTRRAPPLRVEIELSNEPHRPRHAGKLRAAPAPSRSAVRLRPPADADIRSGWHPRRKRANSPTP